MRKLTWSHFVFAAAGLALAAGIIYQFPPVRERLSWRIDFAWTYLRGLVNPIAPPPTALPDPDVFAASTPTQAATLLPTPTVTPLPEFTATPLPSPTPLPSAVSLPSPAWERQDINNCGPASLTMYLRFYGWEGNQTDIADVLKPFREDRNVNVEELVYYVRTRAGWLNAEYRVGGSLALLKQLTAAGIPVMIEETFYFDEPYWVNDDLWAAHYQLVTGYDEAAQTFVGQDSFHGADQQIPYRSLDEYWQAFNRVYILIYLPHQEEIVKAILGPDWEPDANRQRALEVAQAETQSGPQNAFAWFNLGANLTYFERYIEATDAYDQARALGLPQRMLRYQFGPFIAYFHTGQLDDLLSLTEYALQVTPNSEEALLWHGWALYRQGKTKQAVENFQQALLENPNYLDAQYALDFVKANP
ncbi:MAG: C39 family peptidase [Anaerolineales bacterium]|nr:C39 family peptidase [Anaerolineales bacterium]